MTSTPDPVYSLTDRISGTLNWHGNPLGGIPVDLYNYNESITYQHTVTDELGRYYFLNVGADQYSVRFNSKGKAGSVAENPLYTWISAGGTKSNNVALVMNYDLSKTDLKIIFPTQGISFNTTTPVFSWQPYPDAAYYTIILDWLTTNRTRLENDSRINGTTYAPKSPLQLGKYSMRTSAWDAQNHRFAYGDVSFAIQ
jgi:hypothetical protein